MNNKGMIIRECERLNEIRRAYIGKIDHHSFFSTIHGDLLISGCEAGNLDMITDLVCTCMKRNDCPTIVLSAHLELLKMLHHKQTSGEISQVMISSPYARNYHPFYGMSPQQILRFICRTAEEFGYGTVIDQVMVYTSAVLNTVAASYPVSLPAMTKLLQEKDEFISRLALQSGLSNIIAENIRGNHEGGIVLRRVCERLEEIFEDVYISGSDTKYNFQSGAIDNVALMAFYTTSVNQKLMNSYLKEELFFMLRRVPRTRVIIDEMEFSGEDDEFLKYLFQVKREGKIELILISKNVKEAVRNIKLDFSNVILFQHNMAMVTEELSRDLFGTYQYHFPVPTAGNPPAMFFTLKKEIHWQMSSEERLRIRAVDMSGKQSVFGKNSNYLVVKTTANENVYLIDTEMFFSKKVNLEIR